MKLSKNQLRRAKKKAQKTDATHAPPQKIEATPSEQRQLSSDSKDVPAAATVASPPELDDPLWEMYKGIVGKFDETGEDAAAQGTEKPEIYFDDEDEIPDEDQESEPKISKKKRKELNKLSVAELKAMVRKPEIVEWTDTSASDPRLLIHIKAHRNVVPVPSHWSLKREYLSSKRGVEKAPFALPKFIQETGIAEMRDAALDKQEQSSLKQKQRERVQPKMGRLDIDYQKLYEAFFRFQTKPELTRYGEIYYEGKEYETNLKHLRPGDLSDELKEALNMPPVDEHNRPLYGGDIFGVLQPQQNVQQGEPVEKDLWGELQASEESEEESEEEDEEEDENADEEDDETGTQSPSGLETPSGVASAIPSEPRRRNPLTLEVLTKSSRRDRRASKDFSVATEHMIWAPLHALIPPVLGVDDQTRKRKKPGDVDVSVDLDAIQAGDGLSKDSLQNMYEAQRQQQNQPQWGFQEDLSDMIAQESRKRLRKEEERR
ncbi:uncharacterized protein N7477_008043, partial [Penicillium maclennaniae]|uniref:uncharacterized protein n=1 Tax=Penicillium maclennaniae TaxID=1343394 RepID=UPI00253FED42